MCYCYDVCVVYKIIALSDFTVTTNLVKSERSLSYRQEQTLDNRCSAYD